MMNKINFLPLMAAFVLTLLASCSKKDNSPKPEDWLTAERWYAYRAGVAVSIAGVPVDSLGEDTTLDSIALDFKKDYTAQLLELTPQGTWEVTSQGTWTLSADAKTLEIKNVSFLSPGIDSLLQAFNIDVPQTYQVRKLTADELELYTDIDTSVPLAGFPIPVPVGIQLTTYFNHEEQP
ncbi:MAG: hypothetical protein KatS3mg033_2321 [Thermonema sp.]|jgi:hypothetical protein|uniref:hypothetical protein n=1 Tax=Thermonema sp. TaxID=2231181 RepID=UPI0021DDAC06|nr:hypothetical protein [Thermonema sp.]GIV40521.1 MAG: hypothetical protein KatS3mg033_2321 [Thermonema sp.]